MYTEKKAMLSANVIDERPDFGRILECLKKESAFGQENVLMLISLANAVKPMEETLTEERPMNKGTSCLLDCLWQEINIIQNNNLETQEIIRHLQRIIGV